MQTPSQLLTQEVPTVHCTLMREADTYFIFCSRLDVALLTPCEAYPVLSGPPLSLWVTVTSISSQIVFFPIYFKPFLSLIKLIKVQNFNYIFHFHFWESKYLKEITETLM